MERDKYLGKRLEGRYEIQALIGMGGMANVYKAFDTIDNRTVAVKILRDEFAGNAEFLRRFKNESKAIAVLSHPNIVRVFDVSFTNRIHSIVMEYIDGITLKDYIERQSVLTWKEAVHFSLQILRALQHAHDKGIVHRDIKPQNIMLLQNGTIKVTDFGIARFARSEVKTITDRAIGSVHYISPEQAMGGNTDEKADIYSVGVMLFEMLTGRLPFEADSPVSVAIQQIQSQAVRPSSINPDIPPGLEEITVRAMQKDAGKRYASSAEMIADIESFKQNPSIHFEYKYLDNEHDKMKDKKIRKAIRETREEEDVQRRRKTPYIPILTGVTLAFVLASLAFIGLMLYYNNPFVQVGEEDLPNLVGLKFETAVAQNDDKFEIIPEDRVYSDEFGKDVIIEQRPRAGLRAKLGSQVRVTVSLGQFIVEMPNFAGRDVRQAVAWLHEHGLESREEKLYSEEVPAGCVIYTDPSRDSSVTSGTVVTVYVSMGPERLPFQIESVVGLTLDEAREILERRLLVIGSVVRRQASDEIPDGTILAQEPLPGTLVNEGTDVTLVVADSAAPPEADPNAPADDDEGRPGSSHRVRISVELPDVDEELLVRARINDRVVAETTVNPRQEGTRFWRPTFSTTETGSVLVRVYINRRLHQDITVDIE
ncbi:MAG: Stk1 family PASTA domain-containing Ser/Thr kinase [Oscillospiraceae bacterium]|nr:Stk1 family PASTA domain-containing Ser/Thr kinase [Oscillospiraceae bacterium]